MRTRETAAALLLSVLPVPTVASSTCEPDGLQDSGSIYRICLPPPERYNGSLVVWAHGFQDAGTPVQIPEDQLTTDTVSLPELVTDLGFGFATNSYSKTGLAVRQGMDDIVDLVDIYTRKHGAPRHTYLVGASEGGIITALLTEQRPDIFDGGIAACGPVGDFPFQIDYFGHARATFEYFFPGVIPGDPFDPPATLVAQWSDFYARVVQPIVFHPQNAGRLKQWVDVARLPFDADDYLATVAQSASDTLRYSVVNLKDAADTLGGMPFGNRFKVYTGSVNDLLLNLLVPRVDRSPAALAEMRAFYNTTGILEIPLITLHTLRDQQIPYAHEVLYWFKTLLAGSWLTRHISIPIDRYGHCQFQEKEALVAFGLLLLLVGGADQVPPVLDAMTAEQRDRLGELAAAARRPPAVRPLA